jgi:hypothetical protein
VTHTVGRTPLGEGLISHIELYKTKKNTRDIHAHGGIRTRKPNKREAMGIGSDTFAPVTCLHGVDNNFALIFYLSTPIDVGLMVKELL